MRPCERLPNLQVLCLHVRTMTSRFIKTKNSGKIVFYKYEEATYNNGNVWMVKKDKIKLLYKADRSINHLSLSKDDKWLVVEKGSRLSSDLVLVDMLSEKALKLNKLINEIMINPINNYSSEDIKNIGPLLLCISERMEPR